MDSTLILGITSSRIHHIKHRYFSICLRKVVTLRCYLVLKTNRELQNIAQRFFVWSTRGKRLQRVRSKNYFDVLERHPCARPSLARFVFPVYLLYRTQEKFNDTSNFLMTFGFACVPINHYYFSGVQQQIWNLLLQHNSQIIVLELICGALLLV